jgi:uncharacterized membrane protein (DUF106 family)
MTSSGAGGPAAPKPPSAGIGNQMFVMMAFVMAMIVMFDQNLRQSLGKLVGVGLFPLVGFSGREPIITLLLTGLLMSFFSITVRHLFSDWIEQARNARITSAFQKELREARTSNNTYKLKKLTELQPKIMAQSLKASQTQLKLMPVTMLVIIPIFAWLANFVYIDVQSTTFSVPWSFSSNLKNSNVLPNWILLYSLMTLPFGQVLTRVLKHFSFSRRLRELESGAYEGHGGKESEEEGAS